MTGCSQNRNNVIIISDETIDSAVFLRFEVPNVRRWSIGVLYHDTTETDSDSAIIIWSEGPDDIFAGHWSRENGNHVHSLRSERIGSNIIRVGPGKTNELFFGTASNGSFLRLNDETVIEVPMSQLIRRNGRSRLCVGFYSDEGDPYSISYSDLRTRFTRKGAEGVLNYRDSSFYVECPTYRSTIAHGGTDLWLTLDFTVPDVDHWSFGIIHLGVDGIESGVTVFRDGVSSFVQHIGMPRQDVASYLLRQGEEVNLEFETSEDGSSLLLNGLTVLDAPGSLLTRHSGRIKLCTGLYYGEGEPYKIRFSDLWAWVD